MRGTTNTRSDDSVDPVGGRHQVSTLVAIEVMLLWPRGVDPSPVTTGEAGLWPVFVLVVSEPSGEVPASVAPLFELVERPRLGSEMAVVSGECRWSVLDARNALLKVELRARAPERFAVDVLVPARRVLGVLDVVARGATVGITTSRHAGALTGRRIDIRRALHEVVLLNCEPSTELSAVGALLG